MNKDGAIIIVEDDPDDKDIITQILSDIGISNETISFSNGEEAYSHLTKDVSEPFLIISDINMPKMNGIELKHKIQIESGTKFLSVPFILMSTAEPTDNNIKKATKSVQEYFKKPNNLADYKKELEGIIGFWTSPSQPWMTG
ncbi:MAG TPA: response regulator [Ferruginibacter sp.]|nr:response regulator [Ferruginibacter sp.]